MKKPPKIKKKEIRMKANLIRYGEVTDELSPKTVKVIEADEIARVMNDSEIGTHHVLLSNINA